MNFWNNPVMDIVENVLLKLSNYVWKKRHPSIFHDKRRTNKNT